MKKLLLLFLLLPTLLWAAPPSRSYTYTTGEIISAEKNTQNEDAIFNYLSRGVDKYAASSITTDDILDGTLTNADISGTAGITFGKLAGSIPDSKLAQITTANKVNTSALTGTIASTNLSGVTLPTGAVFYMITGSCPSGTTDVTATYSNKFIKINATQGTSSGTVLTGTSDSHTLITAEMPAHTHTYETVDAGGDSGKALYGGITHHASPDTSSTGGGLGHTHTLSSATTLEPASITCKMCQVN